MSSWNASSKEELKAAYEKASSWFSSNTNCKVDLKYSSYTDYTSVKPYEESEGFYKRENGNLHILSMGITTIQNEKMCMIADTVNQIVILKNKAERDQSPLNSKALSDLLNNTAALKKQTISPELTAYRLEFKTNPMYSAFEFRVNSKGQFSNIIYYYSKEVKEDEEDKNSVTGKPRMEITFSAYQSNIKFDHDAEFSLKKFIKESAGKIALEDHYQGYELKDYRLKEKK